MHAETKSVSEPAAACRAFGLFDANAFLRRAPLLVLLVALAAAMLLPIWSVRYVPLVDYPNHLASAFVLAHLKDPAFRFSRFYAADWNTFPYLTMDWILLALQWLFPIGIAGRLLLSLTVLSVPAAAWFFVRRANPGEEGLALWSLLIVENLYFFQYGFINMQLSLALSLVVVGVWLRYVEHPRAAGWFLLLFLTTLLYFTHLMGFGVAGFVITCYLLLTRRPLRWFLLSWALFLPGVFFFLHSREGLKSDWSMSFRSFGSKLGGLPAAMVGASISVDLLTMAGIALCFLLLLTDNPELRWNRPWLKIFGALFLLYWLFPATYGTGINADRRLLPFLFVFALAAAKVGRRGRRIALAALVLFAIRTAAIEHRFVSVQPELSRLAESFSVIPANARVLPLVGWQGGSPSVERNFWAYGVIDRGWLLPTLFHDPGVQPLQMKAPVYSPYAPASFGPLKAVNLNQVLGDYSYVWAYGTPKESALLAAHGTTVFAFQNLKVIRVKQHLPGS